MHRRLRLSGSRALPQLPGLWARAAALRPLARDWLQGLHALIAPQVGEEAAHHISALLDGTMLHSLVTGDPLNAPSLTAAIRSLAGH